MRASVAVIRLALGCAAMGGFILAGCGDDESDGGGTATTQTGTGTPSGSATGTGTPSGSATGTTTLPTCAESCAAVMAADCDNGPQDMTGCQDGCAATEIYCASEMETAATCGGADPTYTCTANGVPAVAGCESQYTAVVACLGGVVQDCIGECTDVLAASCTNPADMGSCSAGCAAATADCPTEYSAMVTCQGDNPTYECNTNGVARPVGCGSEHDALMACLNS